jgi:threonine aldolase
MAAAEVGDDVFGEDPSVNRLESMAAATLGKEAGLLVVSGTMGNMAALLAHCGRGDEMILGDQAHSFLYEQGGSAGLGGIHPRALPNLADGTIALDAIEAAIRGDDQHFPRTKLICLENSHNRCGGAVLSQEYEQSVRAIANDHGLAVHLDGARVFNAAAALGVPVAELAQPVDSVTFCLSKGLAAPVGSVLCGSREFISRARRTRKVLGGGMRQAGVIAAAGIVALEQMVDRLVDDHVNARRLAQGLLQLPGISIDPDTVETNIVIFELHHASVSPSELVELAEQRGVKLFAIGGARLRAVTHYQVSADDIDFALEAFEGAL